MRQGATPVPIPNTTVKTLPADDTTAQGCGKAGGCRAFLLHLFKGLLAYQSAILWGPIGANASGTIKTEYREDA